MVFHVPASSPRNCAVPTRKSGVGTAIAWFWEATLSADRHRHRLRGDAVGHHDEPAWPGRRPAGTVNLADEAAPGAIETDVQLLVRA